MKLLRLVVAGALAGLYLGLVEGLSVGHAAAGYFDGRLEWVRLVAGALVLGGAVGVVSGALVGLVAVTAPGWARVWAAVLTAPYAGWAAWAMWSGGKARTLLGRPVWIALSALLLCVAVAAMVTVAARVAKRDRGAGVVVLLLAICVGLYHANQTILPRLYPFFHTTLMLLTLALALLAFALVPVRRSFTAAAILVGIVTGTGAVLATLGGVPVVRSLLIERALLVAPLAKWSRPPRRHASPHASAAVAAALPAPPHLDGDLVIITVDAMRADRLNAVTAPRMNALAAAGVRVERAYAQVPHTSFSIATLMTGKYVYSLSTQGAVLDSERDTLAQLLRRERFKTAAFFPPAVFFIDRDRLADFERTFYGFEYVKYEFLAAPARTDQVIKFLETEQPKRAFLWVHYLEPHEPYDVHPGGPPASASDRERYDGEVRFVDGEVGRLIDYLRVHRPGALVVLAADHGEEMGEHGGRYHGTTVYEEQTRIPLVLARLGGAWPTRVLDGPVGLVDVLPTVLGLLGITPSVRVQGHSFAPWLNPEVLAHAPLGPTFAEIGAKKMVTDGHDKLVCDVDADSCALYDLTVDPGEKRNLGAGPRADGLRALLDDWMARQSRFEASSADELLVGAGQGELKRALERGRRGERAALPGLLQLLTHASPIVRREAARLVATLPPDPTTRGALQKAAGDSDAEVARDATVALCRLGGEGAACQRTRALAEAACSSNAPDVCGRGALALHDVGLAARALGQLHDALDLELALVDELAGRGKAEAFTPLLLALADVRLRLHTVGALARFGEPRTVEILARWAAHEPYVPARAAMATALGHFAAVDLGGKRALAARALADVAATENEAPVMAAAVDALAEAKSPLLADPHTPIGGEVWLVGHGPVHEGQTLHASDGATAVQSDALEPSGSGWTAHLVLPRRARWTYAVDNGAGAVDVDRVYVRPNARTHSK